MENELSKLPPLNLEASNPVEVVDAYICQTEAKYDLLQYKVDDWCVWPLLRFGVALELQRLPLNNLEKFPHRERLAVAIRDVFHLANLRKARYVVKSNSLPKSEKEGDLYKDIYFDDLLLNIGSYFKIEDVVYKVYLAESNSVLVKSDITSTAFVIATLLLARIGGPPYVFTIAKNLSLRLRGELGLDTFTPQKIAKILLRFYWSKKLYAWLLRQIQPEYLFLITAYGSHAIVAAAKEQGIQVIEFQHGFLDRYHPGYSWPAYALTYKASMPIPDRIFLYGERWKQELKTSEFWNEELRVVGSVRMDQYRKMSKEKEGIYTILLTTQYTDTERLIAFMSDFLQAGEEKLKFRLYIKLHPAEQSKDPYVSVFQARQNVCVLLGHESPSTFELLTRAHLHVSIASTCHYEALALGVPTVILPFAGSENVLHLYKEGHAFLAQTPQDLLDIVVQMRHHKVPVEISEWYFATGALENIKKELAL
jgi:hypothetical protein